MLGEAMNCAALPPSVFHGNSLCIGAHRCPISVQQTAAPTTTARCSSLQQRHREVDPLLRGTVLGVDANMNRASMEAAPEPASSHLEC
jgi:hypothetical protein